MGQPQKMWYRKARNAYYVEIRGKQHLLAKGKERDPATVAKAKREFHRLMAQIPTRRPERQRDPTVSWVFDRFRSFSAKRDAPSTLYEREIYLRDFEACYGVQLVQDCCADDIYDWLDAHPQWESEWTQHYAIRSVMRPFNWAVKAGRIAQNPFWGLEWPECNTERRPISLDEFNALLDAAGPGSRIGEVLRFLRYTGCRPGEVRHLRWPDVHFETETPVIIIKKHKTSRTQRKPQPRVIPMMPEVVSLLTEIAERRDHHEYVFVTRRRTPWARSSLPQAVRRLRRKIGLPEDVVLYGVRHRVATDSVENGNSIKTTADLLGQRLLSTTQRYVHPAGGIEHMAAAMARATGLRRPV